MRNEKFKYRLTIYREELESKGIFLRGNAV